MLQVEPEVVLVVMVERAVKVVLAGLVEVPVVLVRHPLPVEQVETIVMEERVRRVRLTPVMQEVQVVKAPVDRTVLLV